MSLLPLVRDECEMGKCHWETEQNLSPDTLLASKLLRAFRYALRYLLLGFCAQGISALAQGEAPTEPMYMLKFNWMQCDKESDVIDLANTVMGKDYFKVLMGKIITGACTKPALFMTRVTAVEEKRTSAGRTYYCLNVLTPETDTIFPDGTFKEIVEKERTCVLPYMLTTVDAELSSRTGDFEILIEDEFSVNAKCIEGGRVQMNWRNGELLRSVFDLTWKRPRWVMEVPVKQDVLTAIRDGCKGADVW